MATSPDPETRVLERYLRRPTRRRLAAVVRVCQDHLWGVALRLAGHPDDAADLCQDVFLGLLNRPPPAGSVRSARGWFAARLTTVARDRRRSTERRARREAAGVQRFAEAERLEPDEVEAVRQAVADLPERLRTAVELRYFAGLPNREVAAALGVAEPTVDKDLRRARELLGRRLGRLVGVLSILAAGTATPAATAVPAEVAARWLQVIDWSPALFPHSVPALLEALLVKKSLIALAAVIIIAAAWYAAAPRPTVAPLPGTRVAATSSLPAPGSNVPTEAAPEVEAPRLAGAAPESEAAEPASGEREPAMGSFRLKVLWAGDGTPAGALGVEVWPRWCETPLLCGRAGVTGDDGVLVLDGLVPGRYSFRTALGTNGRLGALKPFEVAAGEETRLVIRAEDGIHLRGIVVDAADRPVPGAAIWLAAESFDPMGGDVVSRSGPDGRFELRGVGDGGLYVSARAPGHAPSSQIVVVSRHAEEELRLVLPAAGGAVRGRVIGADGMPVEGAWVLVGAREFTSGAYVAAAPPARSRTDGGGEFAVEGIATGRTPILVRSPPHALAETAVEVAAGSVGVVTIALQAGAVFGGTVTSADGRPVEGAEVRLGKGEDEAPRSDLMFGRSDLARLGARTRAGGEFAIEGAPPGDWHVDIDAGNRGRERRTVVLTAGLETRIEVSLRPPLRLRGRVRCRDGQALAKALVVIYPGGSTEIADGSGRFAFQGLEDREYSLRISELRAGIAAIRRQGLRPTAEEIEVVVEDEERASGGIAGRVVDAGGKGVAGALLTAEYVELPGEADRARSDASGGFLFERLPAGTYRVRADVEGQPRAWASDARVAAGERIDLGTVMIPLPGFLAASVTLLDGGMKEKVYYGIVDAGGRYALAVWLSSDPVRRDPLVPGRYRLIVRAPGAGDVEREFEIEAGRETRLDVEVGKP